MPQCRAAERYVIAIISVHGDWLCYALWKSVISTDSASQGVRWMSLTQFNQALFFHIFYLACVGYPMHNLSLCLWDELFGPGLNATTTNMGEVVSAGAGCPEVFNLYFMFTGGLVSIVFLVS